MLSTTKPASVPLLSFQDTLLSRASTWQYIALLLVQPFRIRLFSTSANQRASTWLGPGRKRADLNGRVPQSRCPAWRFSVRWLVQTRETGFVLEENQWEVASGDGFGVILNIRGGEGREEVRWEQRLCPTNFLLDPAIYARR